MSEYERIERPWGFYEVVCVESGFQVKHICVYPGKRLSLQSHNYRSEHWVIVKGVAKVQVGENIVVLNEDNYSYITKGIIHRIENIGNENMEFIETQYGSYLGEDDIIRYEDDFGRV